MTATTTFTAPTTRRQTPQPGTAARVWRTGVATGISASLATAAFAAIARSIDVPLKVSGSSIPLLGFAEVTFVAAIIGTVLAARLSRRAHRPRQTFVTTTIVLTFASFIPDVLANAHTATKVALVLSHVVAAAVVIPALASRLGD